MCYDDHNNAHFIDKKTVNVAGKSVNIQSWQISIQIIMIRMSISQPLLKILPRASQRHEVEVPYKSWLLSMSPLSRIPLGYMVWYSGLSLRI